MQLLQSDWTRIQPPVHGLRHVTYATTKEIPSLLADLPSQDLSSQMPSSDLPSGYSPLGINVDLEEGNTEDDHIDALNEDSEILSDQEGNPDIMPRTDLPEDIHCDHEPVGLVQNFVTGENRS